MAVPIESFQDILDVLEQNPEYREAMRRHIMDEEVRRLPAEFRALRETVDSLARAMRDYMQTTNERLGRVESDVSELKEGQARLEAGQTRLEAGHTQLETSVAKLEAGHTRLETSMAKLEAGHTRLETSMAKLEAGHTRLETSMAKLEAGHIRLEGRIGDVAGTAYERRIVKQSRRIADQHLGIRRAKILHSINLSEHEALDGLIDAACEANSITYEQAYRLDLADVILTGDVASGQAAYAVIEVSETIDDSDVDRAHERAAILARVVSETVIAAVIGKAVSDANRQRAAQSGVTIIIMAE